MRYDGETCADYRKRVVTFSNLQNNLFVSLQELLLYDIITIPDMIHLFYFSQTFPQLPILRNGITDRSLFKRLL